MRRRLGIVLLSAIGLLLVACSSGSDEMTDTVDVPSDWVTYTDEISGFSITYPSEWDPFTLDDVVMDDLQAQIEAGVPEAESLTLLLQAGLPQPDGGFNPSVEVVVEGLPSDWNADGYAEVGIDGFKAVFPSYETTDQTKTVVDGRESLLIRGSYELSDLDPSLAGRLWMIQLITVDGRVGWSVICGQSADDASAVEPDLEECEIVVRTFEILDS